MLMRIQHSDNTTLSCVIKYVAIKRENKFCKGPKLDAWRSQSVISTNCYMILFINISSLLK